MLTLRRHQILYWLLLLGCLFTVLILPSFLPVQTETEKQQTKEHNNAIAQTATVASIFNNNLIIGLIAFVPFIGWGYLLAALWNTGVVVASYNLPSYTVLLNVFAWVELAVYSYIVLQSVKLVHLFQQRKCNDFKASTLKLVAYTLITTNIVLLVSALLEYTMLRQMI